MKTCDTSLYNFLITYKVLEKYTSRLEELGENAKWYLEHIGNEPYAILMTFSGWFSGDELLEWEIIQDQYLYYLEEWYLVNLDNIRHFEWEACSKTAPESSIL